MPSFDGLGGYPVHSLLVHAYRLFTNTTARVLLYKTCTANMLEAPDLACDIHRKRAFARRKLLEPTHNIPLAD